MKKTQRVYKNCKLSVYSSNIYRGGNCEIRFEGQTLIFSFTDGKRRIWRYTELGPGHYACDMEGCRPGEVTLHQFEGGDFLEGSFKYHDGDTIYAGMLRITMGEPWKDPKKGDTILLRDVDKWVEQKITTIEDGIISTKEFNDVVVEDIGETWKLAQNRKD